MFRTATLFAVASSLLIATACGQDVAPPSGPNAKAKPTAAVNDPVAKEVQRIQGKWVSVAVNVDGHVSAGTVIKLTFSGDKAILTDPAGEQWREGSYVLRPATAPKEIDLTMREGDKNRVLRGIYELTENELKICIGVGNLESKRPTGWDSNAGTILTLKRADAVAKAKAAELTKHARLVLDFRVNEKTSAWRPEKMHLLVSVLRIRLDPDGQKGIYIRGKDGNTVEIVVPLASGVSADAKTAEANHVRKVVSATGLLEFLIVATRLRNASEIDEAKAQREAEWKRSPGTDKGRILYKTDPTTHKPYEFAEWCKVRDQEVSMMENDPAAIKLDTGKKNEKGETIYRTEVLVLAPENESVNVTGKYIRDAAGVLSHDTGEPIVAFTFNSEGGEKFYRLTSEFAPQNGFQFKLAIVLDHTIQSAPALRSAIGASAEIAGNFTMDEVKNIALLITSGCLPAELEPTPVREVVLEPDASSGAISPAGGGAK